MDNNLLIKLQHFFVADMKIKKEMYEMVPPNNEEYLDNESLIKYVDELNDSLIYIFSEFKCFVSDLFGDFSYIYKKIIELESKTKNEFYRCGTDINKLRVFYKQFVSNLSKELIDRVKKDCVGYGRPANEPFDLINTVNEMLHYIHANIINDETLLQELPLLDSKNNNFKYPIRYRGINNNVFDKIFNEFPLDLDCGWTDIVSINEKKLIMMVRDRGHALSIEITINNNIARVEYFVPKICNVNMVNSLPGVNKIKDHSIGATGVFEVEINMLNYSLYDFISKVPMDDDMEIFKNR